MMTREEILSIEEYCVEHNVSHKDRLEELGMFSWSYYAAKQCHVERSETSFPRLLSQVYCELFYFCHVERSETSLAGFLVTGPEKRSFTSFRMTREVSDDREDAKSASKLVQAVFFKKNALTALRKLCNFETLYRMLIGGHESEVLHMYFSSCDGFGLRKDY